MIAPHPAELGSEFLWVWTERFGCICTVLVWSPDPRLDIWTDFGQFQVGPGDDMGDHWDGCAGDPLTGLPVDTSIRPVLKDAPVWFRAHLSELGILD